MSKRKKILLTILTVILALTLVVSLAACKKPGGGRKTGDKDGKGDDDQVEVNDGSEVLTSTINHIEKTLLKDLAAGLGVEDGEPQIRLAGEVAISFNIEKSAAKQLEGFLGEDFTMTDDINVEAVISADVVIDKDHSENNIAMIDIAVAKDGGKLNNILSLCLSTEEGKNVLYVGERLIHSDNMNWVKLDYPQVDYIDWVAEKMNFKSSSDDDLLAKFSSGTFVQTLKIVNSLLPLLTENGLVKLLKYDNSESDVHKFSINFARIDSFLNQLPKNLTEKLDVSGLFDLNDEMGKMINNLVCLVLGADASNKEMNGLEQLLNGEIATEKQPEVSLVFYDKNNDPEEFDFNGLGLHYDGTKAAESNGVKFGLDIKNLVVENLKNSNNGSKAKEATKQNFFSKTNKELKDIKPLSLQLEVGLENITEVDNTLLGLESAKVVVDVYPGAKLGWRLANKDGEDPAKYFAANLDGTYAEASFIYKKIGDTEEEALIGVMEGKEGLRLDLTPVFEALGATIPDDKTNVFMKWNFDLSKEIEKAVENAMKADGYDPDDTPDGYIPKDLFDAPSFAGDEVPSEEEMTDFGKFVNGIIRSKESSEYKFEFKDALPGIQFLISNILVNAVNDNLNNITVTADKTNLDRIELIVEKVGELFTSLMKNTTSSEDALQGLIGASGIYWLDKDGNVELLSNFLADWNLDEVEIAGKKLTEYIAKIVGGEISNNFWTEDTTSIDLLLNRENGLELALTVGANAVVSEESKPLKAKVSVKLDILGRDIPKDRKELVDFDDENAILFGSNNYDEALTEKEHNQWRKVLNALLEKALPEGVVPFKMKTEVTLNAGEDGNYGENIESMKVVVNAGTIEEKDENDNHVFMLPNAPEGKVFSKWTYQDGDEVVDFEFGVTEIPEGEFELTAVFVDA